MRIISYWSGAEIRSGIEISGDVIDTAALCQSIGSSLPVAAWTSNRQLVSLGLAVLKELEERAAQFVGRSGHPWVGRIDGLKLAPPILDPQKIICVGLNYREHATEVEREVPPYPTLFAKFRNSLTGPADPIRVPRAAADVDYEGELAIVIGNEARAVTKHEALNHVVGAMVINDVSSRKLQYLTTQWLAGKSVDTFAPCGPALVTLEELGDIQNLQLSTRVNGETVQSANTGSMIWSAADLVSIISQTITLQSGDIILTGTPSGVGVRRDPPLFLCPGDIVEVEIDGIGRIRNEVQAA